MKISRWNLPPAPDQEAVGELIRECGASPLLAKILCARGYSGTAGVRALKAPGALSDPYILKDMGKAVERIREEIAGGGRIAVFGDYDCDGITATVIITGYLQTVGANVIYYVPDRESEGYGMNNKAVDFLSGQGVSLIITVDNGVSAHNEIAYAKSLGIDVVVTDHHTPRETLPDAVAVVDPHRSDCESGLKELSGAGVAFKLVCALEDDGDGSETLEYYADLVMIGTVADVVPLTGENRFLVSRGLIHLAQTERVGLRALMDRCGAGDKELTAGTVAFTIAPRLNAVGRMGSVDDAIELLLTDDARHAVETAELIDGCNSLRRKTEDEILEKIEDILKANPGPLKERLLIIGGEGWHCGVVGIVAARVMERFGKPAIIFSIADGEARGSARSMPGFSMIEAVSACSEHLERFGGHPLAAGMSLPLEKLEAFTEQIQRWARVNHPVMPWREIDIDCVVSPGELTTEAVESVSALEPFGEGNRPPCYLLLGMTVERITPTSDAKHLRLTMTGQGSTVYAVLFRTAEKAFAYSPGDIVDVVAEITAKTYNNRRTLSVIVRDLRKSGIDQEGIIRDISLYACHTRGEYDLIEDKKALRPDRDEIGAVYRYLRRCKDGFRHGAAELCCRLADMGVPALKTLIAIDVLTELGLVARGNDMGEEGLFTVPNPCKAELESSVILAALS
ncbi:MAG: single-stranded-DNA-specific exonuclease RecJ [Oscillospiraceae bacterium]|nr:single-stranded-DNA-specific exonuclease RecJ [Oscillospiraceae bacterium]